MSNLSDFVGGAPALWVTGTTYAQAKLVISPTDWQAYVRKVAGAGSTDPASDTTNWQPAGGSGVKSIQRGIIAGGAPTTISAVNPAKTELRWLGGMASNSGTFADIPRLALANSTTVTSSGGGASSTVSWELTERY